MNFNKELFAKCIRIKLKNEGISQEAAARQIGISEPSVYLMTRADRKNLPGLYMFFRTCEWLGLTPNDFYTPENEENETAGEV